MSDGKDILLADTAEDFAAKLARVLGDEALAGRLGEAARRRAESHYTWKAAVDKLERFYQELPAPSRSSLPAYRQKANVAGGG